MSDCRQCGKPVEPGNVLCADCALGVTPPPPAMQVPGQVAGHVVRASTGTPLSRRYADAYLAARMLVGLGGVVKILAWVIAGVFALGVLIGLQYAGAGIILMGVMVAALTGGLVYFGGVMLAAQGQILSATADTAVNTSPLLSEDEVRQILSL